GRCHGGPGRRGTLFLCTALQQRATVLQQNLPAMFLDTSHCCMEPLHTVAKTDAAETAERKGEEDMRSGFVSVAAVAAAVQFTPAAAVAQGSLNLICSADVVICELLENRFEKETGIDVNMVRMSSGEAYAKVRAEARNPKTDVW